LLSDAVPNILERGNLHLFKFQRLARPPPHDGKMYAQILLFGLRNDLAPRNTIDFLLQVLSNEPGDERLVSQIIGHYNRFLTARHHALRSALDGYDGVPNQLHHVVAEKVS